MVGGDDGWLWWAVAAWLIAMGAVGAGIWCNRRGQKRAALALLVLGVVAVAGMVYSVVRLL